MPDRHNSPPGFTRGVSSGANSTNGPARILASNTSTGVGGRLWGRPLGIARAAGRCAGRYLELRSAPGVCVHAEHRGGAQQQGAYAQNA